MRQHQQMQLKIEKIENYLGAFIICTRIGVFLCFSFGHRLRCGIYKNNGKYKAQSDQIKLKIEKNYNYLGVSHSMRPHQGLPPLQLQLQVQVWHLQKQWQIQGTN